MRLSLRTLLAFEDNIFDTEQHRQLERLIPRHDAAAMTLGRIRRVIRDPGLGVPGLLDEREELDPNIVAEYLDHQMATEVQERYETFCLSSDKCLAETASIHQILSNVLGEPARTSRECRLRCYDLYGAPAEIPSFEASFEKVSIETKLQSFAESGSFRSEETAKIVPVESRPDQFAEQNSEAVLRLYPDPSKKVENTVKSPVAVPVETAPIEERISTAEKASFFSFFRSFFAEEKQTVKETKETSVSNDNDKRSRGFSFWMLLLFFLLGFGVFFGWRIFKDDLEARGTNQISNLFNKDQSPPTPPQKVTVVVPTEKNTVKAVMAAPKAMPKDAPAPRKSDEMKTTTPTAATVVKKAEPKKQAEKEVAKNQTDLAAPDTKKNEPPKIASTEVKKQAENPATTKPVVKPTEKKAEKKAEVVKAKPDPAPPTVPAPKKEAPQKIAAEEAKKQPAKPAANPTTESVVKPVQKKTEVVETKNVPASPSTVPPITASSPPELPKIVAAEPKKQPEKPASQPVQKKVETAKTAPLVVPPPIIPVLKNETVKKDESPKVVAEERKIQAKPEAVKASAPPPADPFLSAPSPTEPVQTVSWTAQPGMQLPFKAPSPAVKNEWPTVTTEKVGNSTPVNEPANEREAPLPLEPTPLSKPMASFTIVPNSEAAQSSEAIPRNKPSRLPAQEPDAVEPIRPIPIPSPDPLQEPSREPLIAFQPINAPPQRRSQENVSIPSRESHPNSTESRKTLRYEPVSAAKPSASFGKVVHPIATARQFGEVTTVGEVRETDPRNVGRVLPQPEPCVLFSAPSAGEQWDLKAAPLDLRAEQYLLTVTPYRIDVDLGGAFQIEMVGDAKMCVLSPDENGVPGIFVDYGRLVIRSNPSNGDEAPRMLHIRTEHAEGTLTMKGKQSLAFVDTFAEALPTAPPSGGAPTKASKTSPILALLPAAGQTLHWQPADQAEPMTTQQQTSVLLKSGKVGFAAIQSLPNWLQRTPLPAEGRQLAEICSGIFQSHKGNCEAALHALILQDNLSVRFFGYRLWGDLGRFDVPLSLLAEAKTEEEPVRQVLVPYFREVMKRDDETIQRFADAIETVRK